MILDPNKYYIYYKWPYKCEIKFLHCKPGAYTFEVIEAWNLNNIYEDMSLASIICLTDAKLERLTDPEDIVHSFDEL